MSGSIAEHANPAAAKARTAATAPWEEDTARLDAAISTGSTTNTTVAATRAVSAATMTRPSVTQAQKAASASDAVCADRSRSPVRYTLDQLPKSVSHTP